MRDHTKPLNTYNAAEMETRLSTSLVRRLQRVLMAWFRANGRDLPWRKTKDPYAIWISEVMLQQTQVDQVLPYYRRFLEAFPTLYALAKAPLDRVLKVWEGMGYYARARHLHEAAQRIVKDHHGSFPNTYDAVRALPGLGDYAAGAILSIAFDQRHPAVDGNVIRVLSRVFRIEGDPKQAGVKQLITRYAARLIPEDQPGQFNQAVMELGALVCLPKQPQCSVCCWAEECRAHRELPDPSALPSRSPKKPKPHHHVASSIIWKGDEVLIVRRPYEGLLANLWEFPAGTQAHDESLNECCQRHVREELGVDIEVVAPFMSLEHAYSHFTMTLHAFYSQYLGGTPTPKTYVEFRWVKTSDLSQYAFPKTSKVLVDRLQSQSKKGAQLDLFNPQRNSKK